MHKITLYCSLAGLTLAANLSAQSSTDLNEGSQLIPGTEPDNYIFSWWAQPNRFYVIEHSADLLNRWGHIPSIEPGYGEIAQWGFATNADSFFMRLKYTDEPVGSFYSDEDLDGIIDGVEILLGYSPTTANGNIDGDLLTDRQELALGLDPDDPTDAIDSDGDGIADPLERLFGLSTSGLSDMDADAMNDEWELTYYLDITVDDSGLDPDQDGLTHLQEWNNRTNPWAFDSDADTIPDGIEVANGLDPLVPDPVHTRNAYTWQFTTDLSDRFSEFSDRISESPTHSLALDKDGNVYAWGTNAAGQLGRGLGTAGIDVATPSPTQFSLARSVAAGRDTSHIITTAGLAQAAGNNYLGMLGDGTTPSLNPSITETPVHMINLTDIKRINARSSFIAGAIVGQDQEIFAWGSLSVSNYTNQNFYSTGIPQGPYKGLEGVVSLASSWKSSDLGPTVAVAESSDIYLWGTNSGYTLLEPNPRRSLTYRTSASETIRVHEVEPVSYAATKFGHAASLSHDGTLAIWGRFIGFGDSLYSDEAEGQLTPDPLPNQSPIRAIAIVNAASDGTEFEQKPGYFINSEGELWTFFRVIDELIIVWNGSSGSDYTESSRLEMYQVASGMKFVAIAEGYDSLFLLSDEGELYRYTTDEESYTYEIDQTSFTGNQFFFQGTAAKPSALGELEKINIADFYDLIDTNADGLNDLKARFLGFNPISLDTNGDGLKDMDAMRTGVSVTAWDNDGDTIPNAVEITRGLNPNAKDSDGDGMLDNEEFYIFERLANYTLPSSANSQGPSIHLVSPSNATTL